MPFIAPTPDPGHVHVWRISLDPPEARLNALAAVLSPDEHARADRFRFPHHRRRFIAGRAALRGILGRCLGVDPAAVGFAYGEHGKPTLEPASNPAGLEFNLANSHDRALVAVSLGMPLGVDIEQRRSIGESARITARYFTPDEQADFLEHAEADRPAAFLRGWTRKEALLKATGKGIAGGLDSFEVSLRSTGPILHRLGDDRNAAARWTLLDVDAGPDFFGALAVDGRVEAVHVFDLD